MLLQLIYMVQNVHYIIFVKGNSSYRFVVSSNDVYNFSEVFTKFINFILRENLEKSELSRITIIH